ncbi:MAG: hypothetical protein MJY72_00675 [Bacteroidales bacterium]|nr:hypothetical protein [Bacteroidales bacterium]
MAVRPCAARMGHRRKTVAGVAQVQRIEDASRTAMSCQRSQVAVPVVGDAILGPTVSAGEARLRQSPKIVITVVIIKSSRRRRAASVAAVYP